MLPTCRQATELLDVLDDARVPRLTRWGARFHIRFCHKCRGSRRSTGPTARALGALATPPDGAGIHAFRAWRARG